MTVQMWICLQPNHLEKARHFLPVAILKNEGQ